MQAYDAVTKEEYDHLLAQLDQMKESGWHTPQEHDRELRRIQQLFFKGLPTGEVKCEARGGGSCGQTLGGGGVRDKETLIREVSAPQPPTPAITEPLLCKYFGKFGGRFTDGVKLCIVSFPVRHHAEWNRVVLHSAAMANVACVWLDDEDHPEEWQQLWIQNVQEATEDHNRLIVVSPLDERYGEGQSWEIDWLYENGLIFEIVSIVSLAALLRFCDKRCSRTGDCRADDDGGASRGPQDTFMHIALHPKAMLTSRMASLVDFRQMVHELQTNLLARGEQLCGHKSVCLSDTSMASVSGRVKQCGWMHSLVWVATGGHGWESSSEQPALSIRQLAEMIKEAKSQSLKIPAVAFVALAYGAETAAQKIVDAGVQCVFWLRAAVTEANMTDFITKIAAPVIDMAHCSALQTAADLLSTSGPKVLGDAFCAAGLCGNHHIAVTYHSNPTQPWGDYWLSAHLPELVPNNIVEETRIDERTRERGLPRHRLVAQFAHLHLWSSDVTAVKTVLSHLRAGKTRVAIYGDQLAGKANLSDRCLSIALEVCTSSLYADSIYELVHQISTRADFQSLLELLPLQLGNSRMLIWVDFQAAQDVSFANDLETWMQLVAKQQGQLVHFVLTSDSSEAAQERLERMLDDHQWEVVQLELDAFCDARANSAHDEIRLIISKSGEHVSLLESLSEAEVEACIQLALPANSQPIAAFYEDDDRSLFCRLSLSDVGVLFTLRDEILAGKFDERFTNQVGMADVTVTVDKSLFARMYEDTLLKLEELTPHQHAVFDGCTDAQCIHLHGPPGCGKTFVAMHHILQVLESNSNSTVLFVARTPALPMFVAKWLILRVKATRRGQLLSRIHVLFTPFDVGPRTLTIKRNTLDATALLNDFQVEKLPAYSLIATDEAHHILNDRTYMPLLAGLNAHNPKQILLTDIGQSTQGYIDANLFPAGTVDAALQEVVRSSKRIVDGSGPFSQHRHGITSTRHSSEGPPLKAFLFDVPGDENFFKTYAEMVAKAVNHIIESFPGMSLHDRVGLVVPDKSFLNSLKVHLVTSLKTTGRQFNLIYARVASATLPSAQQTKTESLVLDTIENFDGLERLIIVAIGIDARIDGALGEKRERAQRSNIYRAITRAQLMVVVVNEFIVNGHLAYLNRVKLKRDIELGNPSNLPPLGSPESASLPPRKMHLRPKAVQSVWDASNETAAHVDNSPLKFAPIDSLCLKGLPDLVGAMPARSWRDEWVNLSLRFYEMIGDEEVDEEIFKTGKYSIDATASQKRKDISAQVDDGWNELDATTVQLLLRRRQPLAESIINREPSFAASLYAFSQALYTMAVKQSSQQSRGGMTLSPMYKHLVGVYSLSESDPQWASVRVPNENNFYGFLSTAATEVVCEPENFVEDGFAQRITTPEGTSYVCQDSAVVCFEMDLRDSEGCLHAPIMMPGRRTAIFPPNCFFALKEIIVEGFRAPNGVWVRRELLVVTATYHLYSFTSSVIEQDAPASGAPVSPSLAVGSQSWTGQDEYTQATKPPAMNDRPPSECITERMRRILHEDEEVIFSLRNIFYEKLNVRSPKELTFIDSAVNRRGITSFMRANESVVLNRKLKGLDGLREEVDAFVASGHEGGALLKECLEYVLNEAAGSSDMTFQGGLRRDCDAEGVLLKERTKVIGGRAYGLKLVDFMLDERVGMSDIKIEHIAALRLYTTAAFKYINDPLRNMHRSNNDKPVAHPLPLIVTLITEATKQLGAAEAHAADAKHAKDLFRGLKDSTIGDNFLRDGGVEIAPMSTTSDLTVAMKYSLSKNSNQSVLIRIKTDNFLRRGVSIRWLSAFPNEDEILFPPLTNLHAKGEIEKFDFKGKLWTIVTVEPTLL